MKKFYFYGCSFTAGDELSDHEYPELQNHSDYTSYHKAKSNFLKSSIDLKVEYLNKNLSRAYPAKVAAQGFDCKNFSQNGASLDEMIHKIILTVANNFYDLPDMIFLQIPPVAREAIFLNDFPYADSIRLTEAKFGFGGKYNEYLLKKAELFGDEHFAISDIINLYTLKYLLNQKNIKFCLLEMTQDLKVRYDLVESNAAIQPIIKEIKEIPIVDVKPLAMSIPYAHAFAGHYNEVVHDEIARIILEIIKNT